MDHEHRGLRAKFAAQLLGCGESTFWRYCKIDPTFPRPRRVSSRMTVWDQSELLAWRDAKMVHVPQEAAA